MKDIAIALLVGLLAAGLLTALIYYEYAMWSECLDKNSFFYCLRVLSK